MSYVLSRKPKEDREAKALTSIVDNSPPRPVLQDHGQLPYARVGLDICSHHSGVFERQGVVDVHVTRKTELRIPYLDNGNLGGRDANDLFHAPYIDWLASRE